MLPAADLSIVLEGQGASWLVPHLAKMHMTFTGGDRCTKRRSPATVALILLLCPKLALSL